MSFEDISAQLQALEPARARLWDFSPTHDRCVVELTVGPDGPVRYLILLGCVEIHAPTLWTVEDATLTRDGDAYVFRDGHAEIRFTLEAQLVDEYVR